MSSKNYTDVLIGGKVYTLGGLEEESYLQQVASYINEKLTELRRQNGFLKQSEDYQSVMVYLNLADDYFKEREHARTLLTQKEELEKEAYSLKHELVGTQMKIESLLAEMKEQKSRGKSAADAELKELRAELAAAKERAEQAEEEAERAGKLAAERAEQAEKLVEEQAEELARERAEQAEKSAREQAEQLVQELTERAKAQAEQAERLAKEQAEYAGHAEEQAREQAERAEQAEKLAREQEERAEQAEKRLREQTERAEQAEKLAKEQTELAETLLEEQAELEEKLARGQALRSENTADVSAEAPRVAVNSEEINISVNGAAGDDTSAEEIHRLTEQMEMMKAELEKYKALEAARDSIKGQKGHR